MSGGTFDYDQYRIQSIIEHIESILYKAKNKVADDWGYVYEYTEETIKEFENTIDLLRKAYVYTQRVDWLLAGDDGEETFHKRLKEELEDLPR